MLSSFHGDYFHAENLRYFQIPSSDTENPAMLLDVSILALEPEFENQKFPRYVAFAESQNIISNVILQKFQQNQKQFYKKVWKPNFWVIFDHLWSFLPKGDFSQKPSSVTQFQDIFWTERQMEVPKDRETQINKTLPATARGWLDEFLKGLAKIG